jgi:hypothetical protein
MVVYIVLAATITIILGAVSTIAVERWLTRRWYRWDRLR